MKHRFTHNILLSALVAAAMLLLPGAVAAQQPEQIEVEPDDVVSVNARVARLSVSVSSMTRPVPAKVRWEVRHDSRQIQPLTVDAPGEANPLSLAVVVDLAAGDGGHTYSRVRRELESLPSRLRLKQPPRVFVAADSSAGLPLRWPGSWPTAYLGDVRAAMNAAMDSVERAPGTRRALLVLTNRAEDLPPSAFEDADARLRETAAFICLLTFKRPDVKYGGPGKVIARSNLYTKESLQVFPSSDLVAAQFGLFTRVAAGLHVVTYTLGDNDSAPGEHTAEVSALDAARGGVFITQRRTFKVN